MTARNPGVIVAVLCFLAMSGCGASSSPHTESAAVPTLPTLDTSPRTPLPTYTTLAIPEPTAAPAPTSTPSPTGSAASNALGDGRKRPADGMAMLSVPGGTFQMGSDNPFYNNERPPHTVSVPSFWIDATEITNAQYRLCVDAGNCQPPSGTGSYTRSEYYEDPAFAGYPVILVNWYRAAAYCHWVGGRLPTEAEWEYAARGPDDLPYPWGDLPDGNRLNYCDANCVLPQADAAFDDGYRDTAPVGAFPAGASWCGALDMVGNVWEWVSDWYGFYPSEDHPAWLSGTQVHRVIRGGGWDTDRDHARCTFRNWHNPAKSHDSIGFRCVVEQDE